MADLAQLGIQVTLNDQNAVGKLTALSTAADKLTKSSEKLEIIVKRASDVIGKIGASSEKSATKTKSATDKMVAGWASLLGDLKKIDAEISKVGSSQKGIKDLQTNLNATNKQMKEAYEAGKLVASAYNELGAKSDALSLKLKERATLLNALNTGEFEAQAIAAKSLQQKQEQISMEKLHSQALKENIVVTKQL